MSYQRSPVSSQAKLLHSTLLKRGIKCALEESDGYKKVDISISWAKLDIEVDGSHHYLDPDQIQRDLDRTYYSQENDEFDTFHVPNIIVEKYLDKLADAIAVVARDRFNAIKNGEL